MVITEKNMGVPILCVFMHHITRNLAMTEGCFIGEPELSVLKTIDNVDAQLRVFESADYVRTIVGPEYQRGPKCYKLNVEVLAHTRERTFVIVQYDKIDRINFGIAEERLDKLEPVNPAIRNVFAHVPYGYAYYLEAKTFAKHMFNKESCFRLYVLLSTITELRSVGLKELFPPENDSVLGLYTFFFGSGEEYKNFVEKKPFRILTLPELTRKMEDLSLLLSCFDSYSPNQMILKCSSGNVAKN
jgi:hypothetical protein